MYLNISQLFLVSKVLVSVPTIICLDFKTNSAQQIKAFRCCDGGGGGICGGVVVGVGGGVIVVVPTKIYTTLRLNLKTYSIQ